MPVLAFDFTKRNGKYKKDVERMRRYLNAPTLYGDALRVLLKRVKYPASEYSSLDLEVLLLLRLAEMEP